MKTGDIYCSNYSSNMVKSNTIHKSYYHTDSINFKLNLKMLYYVRGNLTAAPTGPYS